MQEALHDLTEMAFNDNRHSGDEYLLVRFYYRTKENPIKSREAGRPIHEEVPYISIKVPGDKNSDVDKPVRNRDKQRFPEHWRRFEARESEKELEGTALTEWPGITRAQAEDLKYLNILTVEQLANLNDANAQNVMGIQVLKQKAVKYLEVSKGQATANALAEANKRIDDLVAMLNAKAEAEAEEAPKPKRKRRTKAEMEAAKQE